MSKPKIRIHNTETNEVIDREMNSEEFAQWEIDQANYAERMAIEKANATVKADLLKKLGITEDEAKLLLS